MNLKNGILIAVAVSMTCSACTTTSLAERCKGEISVGRAAAEREVANEQERDSNFLGLVVAGTCYLATLIFSAGGLSPACPATALAGKVIVGTEVNPGKIREKTRSKVSEDCKPFVY